MFCINCGNQVADGAKFCPDCGSKLNAPEIPAPAPTDNTSFGSGSDSFSFGADSTNNTYDNSFTSNGETTFAEDDVLSAESFSPSPVPDESFAAPNTDDLADIAYSGTEEEMAPKPRSDHGILVSNIPISSYEPESDDTAEDIIPESDILSEPELPEPDFSNIFSTNNDTILTPEEVPDILPEPEISSPYSDPLPEPEIPAGKNSDNLDTIHIPAQEPVQSLYGDIPKNEEPQPAPQFAPYGQSGFAEPAAPQYPAGGIPAPIPAPAYEEAPAKKTKVGGGRIFGASIVAFFAIIFLLTLSMAVCVKFGASGKVLRGRIEKLNKNTVLSAEYEKDEMSNNIYKTLGIRKATHGNADKNSFKEYLSESNMLEFVGENVKNYAEYILEGKGKDPSITAEDIKIDFFKENNSVAEEVFDYKFSKDELNTLQTNMEKNDVDDTLSVKKWNKKAGFDLKNISYALSYVTLGILLALILVFFIWIAIIVDRRGRHVAGFFGNIFFISGLIMFICGLGTIAGSAIVYAVTSELIFYLIPNVLLWFGILALGIGFAELLLSGIFKMIKKNIKRKEKALKAQQNAAPEAVPAYN